jgi:hypothetical protein
LHIRDIAIIGAGPYGLATAARLQPSGLDVSVFGDPMSFWRGMPPGTLLRSSWLATSIGESFGPLSLRAYEVATGASVDRPVPLAQFIDYGLWVQQRAAPDVDRRSVVDIKRQAETFRLLLDDGQTVHARRVVVACGIGAFASRPPEFMKLPSELASHIYEHSDLSEFAGQRVMIVGGGQSALEGAALIREAGGEPEVVVREDSINWLHGAGYQRLLGRFAPLFYAPTDVGPLGLSRIVANPGLFTALPRWLQAKIAHRSIRAAGAAWLPPRLNGVPIHLGERVTSATPRAGTLELQLASGGRRHVDHLLFGTGYQVDIARYPFLDAELLRGVRRQEGYPLLGPGMESSVPGLHFLGAPAAWSFGPTMRFISGSWYASRVLAENIAGTRAADPRRVPFGHN